MSRPSFENLFPGCGPSGLIAPSTANGDGAVYSNKNDEPETPIDPYQAAVQDAFLYLAQGFGNDVELSFMICVRNQIARSRAEKAIAEARKQIAAQS
jgi:hypothetical protein